MAKHRKHIRSSKRKSIGQSSFIDKFFSTILPVIENLEKDDLILLVLPQIEQSEQSALTQGIVVSAELASSINADYVARMAANVNTCGSLEAYFDFRQRNPKWAAKHNPDQMLLNICRAARLVIAYRYGISIGNTQYVDGLSRPSDPSPESPEEHRAPEFPSFDTIPLFITMMGSPYDTDTAGGASIPQSIGYELNGEITLEEYKEKTSL